MYQNYSNRYVRCTNINDIYKIIVFDNRIWLQSLVTGYKYGYSIETLERLLQNRTYHLLSKVDEALYV